MSEEEDRIKAGEYVLGTLPLDEREDFARRMARDARLERAVGDWQNALEHLNDEFAPAKAPSLMPQIEARLFPRPAGRLKRFGGWLGGIGVAGAVSMALLLVVPQNPPPAEVVATLGGAESALQFEARHDGQRLQLVQVAGKAAPEGQTYEFWAIAPGAAPVSLGLIGTAGLDVEYPRPPAGWVLAVSLEPAGGSPTGAPTGPVVAAAELPAVDGG